MGRVLLGFVGALLAATLALPAAAADARRVVLMVPESVDPARQEAALSAVRAQLGDLPLEVIVERPEALPADLRERLDLASRAAKTHGAMGTFVLEIDRSDDLLIYLVEPEARRALMRRIESRGSEAAGFEEMSLIVRSTSSARAEGREIGMEAGPELRPPPPEPEPEPAEPVVIPPPKPPPAEPESASTARLAAIYVGEEYAPEAGWQSGLGLRLSFSPDGRLSAGIGYTLLQSVTVDSGVAAARVTRHPGEVFVAYELPIERVRLGGLVGARLEVATRTTLRTGAGVEPTGDDTRFYAGTALRGLVHWLLTERVAIGAALGADIFFNDSQYVVEVSGETRPVLRPRTVRPRAEAGVTVDLW